MNPLFKRFADAIKKGRGQSEALKQARGLVRAVRSGRGGLRDVNTVRNGMREISRAMRGGPVDKYGKISELIKNTIWKEMMRTLGPLGSIVSALIRPSGRSIAKNIEQELKAAADLLQEFGYQVIPPVDQTGSGGGLASPSAAPREPTPSPRQRTPAETLTTPGEQVQQMPAKPAPEGAVSNYITVNINGERFRVRRDDPLLTGAMIKVKSSNVHSIGYEWNDAEPAKGQLKVRFKDHRRGAGRAGKAGAGYTYYDVHPKVFVAFTKAASKGKFVWDRLRIRGTVSGHQYRYALTTIASDGYVPRKARLAGGGYMIGDAAKHPVGLREVFERRTVKGANGKVYQSALPQRFVGYTQPNRGRPDRGKPNRGR